jgi:hypothetical protein
MNEVERRWQKGIPHNPKSIKLAQAIGEIDYKFGGDYFYFKFGGDGDNGEHLTFLLDILFEENYET